MNYEKISRLGFVIVKLRLNDGLCFLMRKNSKWKDLNFIGGHQNKRDSGNLQQAAKREFWEEVPSSRNTSFKLKEITSELTFGPIFSRSAEVQVLYEVQFFLVKFDESPQTMLESITRKSQNRIVAQEDLISNNFPVTNFVNVLNSQISGGISEIPLSFDGKLFASKNINGVIEKNQMDLTLQ